MANIYQSLLLLIAGATQKELARQLKYLKVENQILRSRCKERVHVTPKEKDRLVKFATGLGKALAQLATIVHPDTIRRWIREASGKKKKKAARGRPKTKESICDLILKFARENCWGYTRIMGEIKKLNLTPPSRNTVKRILKEAGLEPGPKRGEGTWDEFLKQHAATLWQCDFFNRKVMTLKGLRDAFILVFLHVDSRRVFISPATYNPDDAWVCEQARAFRMFARENKLGTKIVMRDHDTKYSRGFDKIVQKRGVRIKKTMFQSPNTNAFVERFIQTLGQECLDHFIVFGTEHMDVLTKEFEEHYHAERPHQSKENDVLVKSKPKSRHKAKPPDTISLADVRCEQKLGGLLKSYKRVA
ncbi:MAG: transposase [Pirellulaceae bacterium]|nr:transposase [Pirellulaceae bacterium]